MPEKIRAQELKYMITRSLEALAAHREEINLLNVFPVPDGDTGTNMYLTLQAVIAEMARCPTMMICPLYAEPSPGVR